MAGRSGRAGAGALDGSPLDESFIVPTLVRFNGHPEVDDAGNLIYTFPDLQASSREQVRRCVLYGPSDELNCCTVGCSVSPRTRESR